MRGTSHHQGVCGKLPQHPSSQLGKVNPPGSFLWKVQFRYTHTKEVESQALLPIDSRSKKRGGDAVEGCPPSQGPSKQEREGRVAGKHL